MKISIIGMPGSGKSTLARVLSDKLSIPHIHLDRFWFESGGKSGESDTPNIDDVRVKVRARAIEAINSTESWVSDGLYSRIQPLIADKADILIFLDIPLWKRLFGHLKRIMKPHSRHNELKFWDEIKFFTEIIRRNSSRKPKFKEFVRMYANKVVILRSWKEADNYVASQIDSEGIGHT